MAVAIPTYLRDGVLVETLRQILSQSQRADEVIVIDQTPMHDGATESYLREVSERGCIRWVRQLEPNLPKARNKALAATTCDVVIFIDDDVVLGPTFVASHAANYRDRTVAAVAGRVVQAKGWSTPKRDRAWPRLFDHRYFRLDGMVRCEGIANFPGGNHSVRRSEMLAIGGYDENYIGWAYREDSDAAIRLWKAGKKIVFDPRASLLHLAEPAGGCRIKPCATQVPEWCVSFPAHYFAVKHMFPGRAFWGDVLIRNQRKYAFRRGNVLNPWRLPRALGAYWYSLARAMWKVSGVRARGGRRER